MQASPNMKLHILSITDSLAREIKADSLNKKIIQERRH